MILKRKATSAPYQEFYPDAVLRFETSSNDAVNKVRTFVFRAYPSINHTDRPSVAQFTLTFTKNSNDSTIFTDGNIQFIFNETFDGYEDMDGNAYTPQAAPTVVSMGYPSYSDVGKFIDETGEQIGFKNNFAYEWLFAQEFEGIALGNDWEII